MTRSLRVGTAAAVLAVAGVGVLVAASLRPDASPPVAPSPSEPSVASVSPTPTHQHRRPDPTLRYRLRGPALPPSAPTALKVESLGLRRPLVQLGVDPTGALEPPRSPEDVGWFTGSVTPGEVGPAVLAGHVTWNGAHAVFFRLGAMRPGDRVEVRRADGSTAHFAVTAVRRYAKSVFPTARVYGPTDRAVLRLITCGGRYDAVRHRYADNVVVFARLVGAS
jgi:hypothetical protein